MKFRNKNGVLESLGIQVPRLSYIILNDTVGKSDGNALQQLFGKAKEVVTGSLDKFSTLLDNMIEGVALFFVTTCLIPIIIMVLLLMLINQLFGTSFKASSILKMPSQAREQIRKRSGEAAAE